MALFSLLVMLGQFLILPSMPKIGKIEPNIFKVFSVLKRSEIIFGMLCVMLTFSGHIAFFTYLRPFLEQNMNFKVNTIFIIFLVFSFSNFLGTIIAGFIFKEQKIYISMFIISLLMSILAFLLIIFRVYSLVFILITIWGFLPVGWYTWLSRVMPKVDEAENAAGLFVAVIQVAVGLGAAIGGIVLQSQSITGTFF